MGEHGSEHTRQLLKEGGAYDAVLRASASGEANIRRASSFAMAGIVTQGPFTGDWQLWE